MFHGLRIRFWQTVLALFDAKIGTYFTTLKVLPDLVIESRFSLRASFATTILSSGIGSQLKDTPEEQNAMDVVSKHSNCRSCEHGQLPFFRCKDCRSIGGVVSSSSDTDSSPRLQLYYLFVMDSSGSLLESYPFITRENFKSSLSKQVMMNRRCPSPSTMSDQQGQMKASDSSTSSPRQAMGTDYREDDRITRTACTNVPSAQVDTFLPPAPSSTSPSKSLMMQQESASMKTEALSLTSAVSLSGSSGMEETPLPEDFRPSEFTVIIGRGKKIRESVGNIHLRTLAMTYLSQYTDAVKNRQAKTEVVNNVLNIIRAVCPNGGAFVRCEQGLWYNVSDRVAREKVGYVFRDLLSDMYESSCKSKTAKRKRQQQHQQSLERRQLQIFLDDTNLKMQQAKTRNQQQSQQQMSVASMPNSSLTAARLDMDAIPPVKRSFSDSVCGTPKPAASTLQSTGSCASSPAALLRALSSPPLYHQPQQPYTQMQQQGSILQHLQQQRQQQQQQQEHFFNVSPAMHYRGMGNHAAFNAVGINLDPLSLFHPRRTTSGVSHDYSDFSEASTTSELDDSTQNPDSTRSARSAPGALSGGVPGRRSSKTIDNDLSDFLSSPLFDCHIERPNERDSSSDD
jgi:hypothetical protein